MVNEMYSNGFVMAVLIDGKPVPEKANGQVDIPYGEYSLRFRNKHKDRRAVVKLAIDGESVSGSGGYIIPAGGFIDIERHFDSPTKFLFVDLNSPEAVDAGKNGPNEDKQKGVIAASFFLEKKADPVTQVIHEHHYHPPVVWPRPTRRGWPYDDHPYFLGNVTAQCCASQDSLSASARETKTSGGIMMPDGNPAMFAGMGGGSPEVSDGCTVEGAHSNQQFRQVQIELEDTATVLRIFLQGYVKPVETALERPGKRKIEKAEKENARLRLELLEAQNEKLRQELEALRA